MWGWVMKFDDWAYSLRTQPYGAMNWFRGVSEALQALAAERAAERVAAVKAELVAQNTPHPWARYGFERGQVSYSHWGMW
jgi:hypothetical protein